MPAPTNVSVKWFSKTKTISVRGGYCWQARLIAQTVQMALMELVDTKEDVHWKKVGRYRLFWKNRRKGE